MKSLPIKNILKNLHIYFYGKKRDNPIMDDPKIIFAHFPDWCFSTSSKNIFCRKSQFCSDWGVLGYGSKNKAATDCNMIPKVSAEGIGTGWEILPEIETPVREYRSLSSVNWSTNDGRTMNFFYDFLWKIDRKYRVQTRECNLEDHLTNAFFSDPNKNIYKKIFELQPFKISPFDYCPVFED